MDALKRPWTETSFVAIDLETTGKYPLDAEICEMAAVKWRGGALVDVYQTLIKPVQRMSNEVIAVHNITNEMVEHAPPLSEKLAGFHAFVSDSFVIAHHAPFDMGFLAWEFEKARLLLPEKPVLCTSLLSQAINSQTPNHRLATLAKHFGVEAGAAHRALDDAKTCMGVALKFFEKLGPEAKVSDILNLQGTTLPWSRFSIESLFEKEAMRILVRALRDRRETVITYQGGSRPGQPRRVFPLGLVRNPTNGDFLVATEGDSEGDEIKPKRYFLAQITSAHMTD